jgi:tripartite ATP-independent transporter DctP family solute receptor
MKPTVITILRLTLALLIAVALASCGQNQKVKVLKLAHTLDTTHPVHHALEFLSERLESISGGEMKLDIYASGQLGTERELIELLQIGGLAMAKVSASPLEGFIPEMKLFSLPYLFTDSNHYWRILNSQIGTQLLQAGEQYRIRGLAYYDAGSRSFYSTTRPIRSPADLSGMKIRVQSSQTAVAMVKSMGGSPTPISFGELYTALQQGVVDGAENNPPSFHLSKHFEVSKFLTLDEHTSVPDIILISTHIWKQLRPTERNWLQQATDESVVFQRKLWTTATQKALDAVEAAGIEIIRPDKAEFQRTVKSIYQHPDLDEMQGLIDRIQQPE